MIDQWELTVPPLTGREKRRAYVYVPDLAQQDPGARFPVLYMFDGHNVFFDEDSTYGKSWGMAEYAGRTDLPMIIAAVECNRHADNSRLCEYSPFSFENEKLGKVTGKGHITMNWLINTFKSYVDSHYPTLPDREHTYLAGSSMGGLMSLYGVMEYNDVFSRAAALSPSVWFATDQLDRMLTHAPIAPDTVIYMDYGSRELPHHGNMKFQFGRVASRLLERGVHLSLRIVPGGNHNEASWERQIPFFMEVLLYGNEESKRGKRQ